MLNLFQELYRSKLCYERGESGVVEAVTEVSVVII